MRDDRVELLVGGQLYGGWTKAGVTRAMDAAAGTFSLSVTDRWAPNQQPWVITPGDPCEVRVGGETVISGYVDIVRPSFSASSHAIEIQGRDRSGDLVDCSAVHDPDEWRGIDLLRLAQILGQPFGVQATAETDVGQPFDLVKLQHGETALEALLRYSKMRKVLVMPDARGGILLTRTGTRRAAVELIQGQNVLEADGTLDNSERFSDYLVKGQAGFSEDTDGEVEAHASGAATDTGVDRYRPLLVVAETGASDASAQDRAAWEANTRIGKAAQATVLVQGWRQSRDGALWQPNTLVRIRAPWLRLDGEMLVRQVTLDKSGGGTTAKLDLVSPQTYEPEPPDGKQAKKAKGGGSGGKNPWMSAIGEDVRNG